MTQILRVQELVYRLKEISFSFNSFVARKKRVEHKVAENRTRPRTGPHTVEQNESDEKKKTTSKNSIYLNQQAQGPYILRAYGIWILIVWIERNDVCTEIC